MISFEPIYELLKSNVKAKQKLLDNGILIPEHGHTLSKVTIKKMIDTLCKTLNMDYSELLEYLLNNKEK